MLFSKIKNENSEEFQQFVAVNSTLRFESLQPYLSIAEREFLLPVLGKTILAQLQAYYDAALIVESGSASSSLSGSGESGSGSAEDSPTAEQLAELLLLAQGALVNLAYYKGWSVLSVQLNNAGATRHESDKDKSLYKYQEDNLLADFKQNGFSGLDAVIAFLEENIAQFLDFKNTTYYSINKNSLVQTTKDFQAVVDINSSGLVFRRLRPYIRMAENFSVIPLVGVELYKKLLAELNGTTESGSGSSTMSHLPELLTVLKEAIPWIAMAEASLTYGANVLDNGLYLLGNKGGISDSSTKTAVKLDEAERLSRFYEKTGRKYLEKASYLMAEYVDEFSEFVGSGDGSAVNPLNRDNTDKKTFWT